MDCSIEVSFNESLKLFLRLYAHQIPIVALDVNDDDDVFALAGTYKTIKVWGLDIGDTHITSHGHDDLITDLRFIRRTHYILKCLKDIEVLYWDGDRFGTILLLT
jgi:U3 small nucleolar RNA-associated protein 12